MLRDFVALFYIEKDLDTFKEQTFRHYRGTESASRGMAGMPRYSWETRVLNGKMPNNLIVEVRAAIVGQAGCHLE